MSALRPKGSRVKSGKSAENLLNHLLETLFAEVRAAYRSIHSETQIIRLNLALCGAKSLHLLPCYAGESILVENVISFKVHQSHGT
jgi:hypothetical protein